MKPKERVSKTFSHIQPDKIPFFELGIDENIAGGVMGRKLFLYDRTYKFKHKLFVDYKEFGKINEEYVMQGVKNTCDLYSFLDMDIVPIRIYSSYLSPFSFIYMGLTDSFDNIKLSKNIVSEDIEIWKIEGSEGFWSKLNFNKKFNTISMQSDSIYERGITELKRFNKQAAKLLYDLLPKISTYSQNLNIPRKVIKKISDFNCSDNNININSGIDGLLEIFPEQIKISLNAVRFALNYNETRDRFILGYGSLCFPTNAVFHPLFLESMISYPDVVYEYLELTTEGIIPVIEAQLNLGVDGIICVNDYAYNSGPIFSPQHFKKFLVPFYKKIVDVCHSYGKPFIKHCDGNINSLIDMFVYDCNFDGIHAIEPSAGMDIYELKKKYGSRITLLGNLDCSDLLSKGNDQEIKEEIYKLKKFLAPRGGYIFSSSNSIHSGIPFNNFRFMVDTFKSIREHE